MKSIVVIGGGAAGMIAALFAAKKGAKVTIFERNKFCGVKLNITGKGRCNLTNDCDVDTLIKNTVCNGKFLYSAYNSFNAQDTMSLFEELGVKLKTERGSRVFPISDSAKEITGALKTALKRAGVDILNEKVTEVLHSDSVVTGVLCQSGARFDAQAVILAAGGNSYPRTGSDGSGASLCRKLGHTIILPKPALVPLVENGTACSQLEGLSLRNVEVTIKQGKKKVFSEFGELIFTSNGLSGPIILSASSQLAAKNAFPCELFIDFKPALTAEQLDKRLLREFSEMPNRNLSNVLSTLLPSKAIAVIIDKSGLSGELKANSITKPMRDRLCSLLKAVPFSISGTASWDEAIITSGGVSVREINPTTMQSKLFSGLYFAGEVIDVDAYTGGFNLQIAWSTGVCAGIAASEVE